MMNDKQPFHCPENSTLQPYSSQYTMMSEMFSPTGNFNDTYSNLLPQSATDRTQNKPVEPPYLFPELPTWDNLKLPEKLDLIEISSKDLSPSTYYNNIDTAAAVENHYNRVEVPQWSNNSCSISYGQKMGNFPSCAQVNKYYTGNKQTTYCNIQKAPEGRELFKSCSYYSGNICYNQNKQLEGTTNSYNNYSTFYDPKYSDISLEHTSFSQNSTVYGSVLPQKSLMDQKGSFDLNYFSTLDNQTEISNDESDIVVEDSSSDCSEEQEQTLFYDTTKCLVCSTHYTRLGRQFYVLTSKNPLTMSSQIPVKNKISQFINDNIFEDKNFLCNDCLGLVNTIDHLQLKLDHLVKDLLTKLKIGRCERTVTLNNECVQNVKDKFKKYRCKKCHRILCIKTLLKNHIKRHKTNKTRGYLCELCGKTVTTVKRLKSHLKIHKNTKITLISAFSCSNQHCERTFRTKFHHKEHENFCLGLLPFKCKNLYCNKKFASVTKLRSHMKLKHDKKFIAICSICNIGFVKVSDYKTHMTSHSTDKKFSCKKCDKSYKTISNLHFHMKSHEKALPHICTICQKGFMRKEYYEAHMNNHKGVKNFGCSICDKKFVSQKNLDAHSKYHEGTVKGNTCNICKKIITSCFEEHLRVHSNLKEFECNICDMKFNTKNSLSKHKKKKHQKVDNEIT